MKVYIKLNLAVSDATSLPDLKIGTQVFNDYKFTLGLVGISDYANTRQFGEKLVTSYLVYNYHGSNPSYSGYWDYGGVTHYAIVTATITDLKYDGLEIQEPKFDEIQVLQDPQPKSYWGENSTSYVFKYIWVPYEVLFTPKDDITDFNDLSKELKIEVEGGANAYNGLGGNDKVTLPDLINGKEIKWDYKKAFNTNSKKGDKYIVESGNGNDIINGGDGKDTVVFSGKLSDYKFKYKGLSKSGGTVIQVLDKRGIDGADVLTDIDQVVFADQTLPLAQWEFNVVRGQDGKITKIAFIENGIEKFSTTNAAYDDATPIANGTYEAIYRTNRNYADIPAIELSNYQGGTNVSGRTVIQIHNGNYTTDSEGCFVASPRDFLNKVFSTMNAELSDATKASTANGISYYGLPIKIKVKVSGSSEQPKINMPKDIVVADKPGVISSKIYYTQDGVSGGISKYADVIFSIKGSTATYGSDFVFGDGVTKIGSSTFKTTIESGKRLDDLNIVVLADKNGAAPELSEKISIKMVDIDLYNVKSSTKKGYAENNSKTLFGLLAGDTSFELTLKGDASKSSSAQKVAVSSSSVRANDTDQTPDTFYFSSNNDLKHINHIENFNPSIDEIRLDKKSFKDLALGTLSPEAFGDVNHKNSDHNDRIIYNSKSGEIHYDSDGNGPSKALHFATLDKHPTLTFQDFLVV